MTRTRTLGIATVAGTGALLALGVAPASAADTATVSVLHAVPDLPVDVYANGERLIDDFQPGTLTDPLQLPAGSSSGPASVPGWKSSISRSPLAYTSTGVSGTPCSTETVAVSFAEAGATPSASSAPVPATVAMPRVRVRVTGVLRVSVGC